MTGIAPQSGPFADLLSLIPFAPLLIVLWLTARRRILSSTS